MSFNAGRNPIFMPFFDSRRLQNHTHVLSVLLCLINFISKMPGIGEDWINNPLGIIQHIIGKKKYISKTKFYSHTGL